jgi:hypothetical protein
MSANIPLRAVRAGELWARGAALTREARNAVLTLFSKIHVA